MSHLESAEDPMSRVAAMLNEHGVEHNEELVAQLLPLLGRGAFAETLKYREYGSEVIDIIDGDTQRFRATQVRLLETNCPEREDDYDGWLAAKDFVTEFLYEEVENEIPGKLILEGRKDPDGRWLGWFVRNDGVNLSYAINDETVGTYVAFEEHLRQLGVADDALVAGSGEEEADANG
jgi:hypothetical protein